MKLLENYTKIIKLATVWLRGNGVEVYTSLIQEYTDSLGGRLVFVFQTYGLIPGKESRCD